MWKVQCQRRDGQVGKMVTDSRVHAWLQVVLWNLKGRRTTMSRYPEIQPWGLIEGAPQRPEPRTSYPTLDR